MTNRFININENIVKKINEKENVDFSIDFYKLIFGLLKKSVEDIKVGEAYTEIRSSRQPYKKNEEEKEEDILNEDISENFYSKNLLPEFKEKIVRIRTRNSEIVRKLKELYNGRCQISGDESTFIMPNGKLYCEVHHLIHLGDKGSDSYENVIVVSPLIHKMLHYATISDINLEKIENNKLKIKINDKEYEIIWNDAHIKIIEEILESRENY